MAQYPYTNRFSHGPPVAVGDGPSYSNVAAPYMLNKVSAKFALMVNIRWPRGTVFEKNHELLREKSREISRTGLILPQKAVVGLKSGAIVSFWENAKDAFEQNVQTFLSKDTTPEKMRNASVLFYCPPANLCPTLLASCEIQQSSEPFRSRILKFGNKKIFRYEESGYEPKPPHTPMSTSGGIMNSMSGRNRAYVPPTRDATDTPSALAQSVPHYTLPLEPPAWRTPVDNHLPGADYQMRPSLGTITSPPKSEPSGLEGLSTAQLLSRIGSLATPQKRPLHTSNVPDGFASAKRFRFGDVYPSPDNSSIVTNSTNSIAHSSATDNSLLQETISSLTNTLKNEREHHEADMARIKEDYTKLKHDERAARDRIGELDQEINNLKAAERELSRQLNDMQSLKGALEHVVSRKKELQNALYAAEEDRRMAEQRERKLQAALDGAESKIKGDALEKALETASRAEEARVAAEEERKSVEDKLLIAEQALASERIKRIAAEETFLDVKNIFGSQNLFSRPEPNGSKPNDSG